MSTTNLGSKRCLAERKPVLIVCLVKGTEVCHSCKGILNEDYYRGHKWSWCRACFQALKSEPRPIVRKARHCRFCHYHIGVPGITYHTTTSDQFYRLRRKENIMWLKFGDLL